MYFFVEFSVASSARRAYPPFLRYTCNYSLLLNYRHFSFFKAAVNRLKTENIRSSEKEKNMLDIWW